MGDIESRSGHIDVIDDDETRTKWLVNLAVESLFTQRATDQVERVMLASIVEQVESGGRLVQDLNEVFAFRRTTGNYFPHNYALRLMEFAIDKQLRQLHGDYPANAGQADWWRDNRVLDEDNLDYLELSEDMSVNTMQSNMANGYGIYQLLTAALRNRWANPVVVDSGVSLGLGLKKWLLPDSRFEPMIIYNPDAIEALDTEHDEAAQERVNELMNEPASPSVAVGYDLIPATTDDTLPAGSLLRGHSAWVFSNTFPMTESITRLAEVEEFIHLAHTKSPKVHIPRKIIDATDPWSLDQLHNELPGGKSDLFIFSALLFQLHPEKVSSVLNNMSQFCNDGALFVVTDFVKPDKYSPHGLSFIREDWWHRPGSFATAIIDPSKPGAPAIPIGRYYTRRAQQMWLTPEGRELVMNGRLPV